MTDQDDQTLITQARRDPQAFGLLYERYVDRIYAFLYRRTCDPDLTEDLTAATFEAAFTNLNKFRWQKNGFGAWLYRIARNKLVQHYRRRRYLAPFNLFADQQKDKNTEFVLTDRFENHDNLHTAFSQLHSRDQEVLALRFFEDLSTAEVAAVLDCSKENVYLRLHRALKRLRKLLEELDRMGEEAHG